MKRPMSILFENATLTTLKPLFSWGLVPGPACYVVEVSQSNGFTTTYTFTITTSLVSLPYDLTSRAFFVWVKDIDMHASSKRLDTIQGFPPASPAMQIDHFITAATTPTWSPIGWATNFLVAVYTNDTFAGIPIWPSHMIAGCATNINADTPLPDGLYYARIRAKKPDGLTWGTEITKSFVVD